MELVFIPGISTAGPGYPHCQGGEMGLPRIWKKVESIGAEHEWGDHSPGGCRAPSLE